MKNNKIAKILRIAQQQFRVILWKINCVFRASITVKTKQEIFILPAVKDDPIGRRLYCKKEYELGFMEDSMSFLRNLDLIPSKGKGTIIDVGANNGVTSIGMLYTGQLEKAIAIEAEPQNFSLLQQNVKQNGLEDKITCLQYAISDTTGGHSLELSIDNLGDHRVRTGETTSDNENYRESDRQTIKVQSETLDNLFLGSLNKTLKDVVVWMDIQGHEGYAIKGGRKLFSEKIPVVSEIWPYGIHRAGMSTQNFCEIAQDIWAFYWVKRKNGFIQYPIKLLDIYFEEVGNDGGYSNVIFTH